VLCRWGWGWLSVDGKAALITADFGMKISAAFSVHNEGGKR
jgi:hypothetical protein